MLQSLQICVLCDTTCVCAVFYMHVPLGKRNCTCVCSACGFHMTVLCCLMLELSVTYLFLS